MKIKNSFLTIVALALCSGIGAYRGAASVCDSIPEPAECKLGKLPVNRTSIPTNTTQVILAFKDSLRVLESNMDAKLDNVDVTPISVALGSGALIPYFSHPTTGEEISACAINLSPSPRYPSYTWGDFNINLGIDNVVGNTNDASRAKYSVAIGTSINAPKMHNYAIGSQINTTTDNQTIIGYGGTVADSWSTVIGHGKRPSTTENGGYDQNFETVDARDAWLKVYHENTFPGVHLFVKNTSTIYTITEVLSEPDANGYRYKFAVSQTGADYNAGQYDWRYGKSHGPGTFNIVTYGPRWKTSPGMKSVYINDDCLQDLVEEVAGQNVVEAKALTSAQVNNGISYISNGYEENGAVQLGRDAVGTISDEAVAAVTTKNTKLRNVGVAIGTRAVAEGSSEIKNQSIAIGYCAKASGSNAIAIGGGARHADNETDENGNNAYAKGATTIALGYSAKAMDQSAIAIGTKAVATTNNAVQIGTGTNDEPNTLKFQDVTIVKDGKLKGFDDTSLDPKQTDLATVTPGDYDVWEIPVNPHVINTLDSSVALGVGKEVGLNPTGSRNYELFIPNTENMRAGMPISMMDEIADADVKVLYRSPKEITKLPVMFKVTQPHSKFVIISAEVMDDGYDWTPVISNVNITVKDITNPVFSKSVTNGYAIAGINLQGATKLSFTYPTSLSPLTTTNIVVEAADTQKDPNAIMLHYYYNGSMYFSDIPATGIVLDGTKTWFDVIYETPNGTATKRVNVDVEL